MACPRKKEREGAGGISDASALPPCPGQSVPDSPTHLIHEIKHLFAAYLRSLETDPLLSQPTARMILMHLSRNEGLSQQMLAELTRTTPPTVCVTLGKMVEAGYVERRPDESDARTIRVYPTAKGREADEQARARIQSAEALVMEGISEADRNHFVATLETMRQNLLDLLHLPQHPEGIFREPPGTPCPPGFPPPEPPSSAPGDCPETPHQKSERN